MWQFPASSHCISFFPAHCWRGIPCNVNVKPELVSCNDDNGVFVDKAASGVQVDFGWFWMMKERIVSLKKLLPLSPVHTKLTVGRRVVFVSRPTKFFSVCSAPSAEVGLLSVCFFGRFCMLNFHRSSSVVQAIWSFWLVVQLANQCTRKVQNRCATWPSGVERQLGVSGQLCTQMWADPTVCIHCSLALAWCVPGFTQTIMLDLSMQIKTFTLMRNIINLDLCGYKMIKLGECWNVKFY